MVKLKILTQFLLDHLSHPVVLSLIPFLRWFIVFTLTHCVFLHQHFLVVFHWILSDSKSFQVSRLLQSFIADLKKAVVWMVSIFLISKSSNLLLKSLRTVSNDLSTICISVNFMFPSFFSAPCQDLNICLYFRLLSFSFHDPRKKQIMNIIVNYFFCFTFSSLQSFTVSLPKI